MVIAYDLCRVPPPFREGQPAPVEAECRAFLYTREVTVAGQRRIFTGLPHLKRLLWPNCGSTSGAHPNRKAIRLFC